MIGVGAAPLFTVGVAYLDDIVLPKYVTIHLGIFYAFSIIGPAIGVWTRRIIPVTLC